MFLPLALVTVIMSILLIGCGGGGGGGNPVATTTNAQLVSVTGQILEAGQPKVGAKVFLYGSGQAEMAGLAEQYAARASVRGQILPSTTTPEERATNTNNQGFYRFDNVPEGEYTLQAENPDTRQRAVITRLVVSAVKGAVTTQNAELQPTSDLAGKITVSGYTGSLAGGRVYLAGTSFLALTDTAGNFRIAYVPTGTTFSLMADFNGAVLTTPITIQAVAGSSAGSPELPADLILVKPTLPTIPTGTITGTVTRNPRAAGDTDDAGTLVSLTQDGKLVTFTETNSAGVYAFAGIPTTPNNIYNIRFMAPNYVIPTTPLSVTVSANGTVTATAITLTPRIQVATLGRFTGQAMKQTKYDPAETGTVQMFLATGTTPADTVRYVQISDVNGIFTFAGVPIGSYQLGCADDRYALQTPTTVSVTPTGNTTPQTFTLVPTRPIPVMGGVSGFATKAKKYDLGETESVQLFLATGTTRYFAVSGPTNGAFAFTGVPVGSYQLGCADPAYAFSGPIPVTVASPTNILSTTFSLVPTRAIQLLGGVSGTVSKLATYDPAETGEVELFLATGTARFHAMSDSAGAFSFTNIPVGTYSLACANPAYIFTAPATVLVASPTNVIAAPYLLRPTMSILGGLTGRLVRNDYIDGEPTMDLLPVKIATGTPGSPDYFEMLTVADDGGYFAFTGIPVGTYSVFSGDLDYVFPFPTTVQAGNPVIDNGDLTLVPNPSVKGTGVLVATITTSLTTPTRVILVSQASPANNRETYAVPLVSGYLSFRMSGLVPGNYELHLDQETGLDIDPMVPQPNSVSIIENIVTPMMFQTVSILPTITAVATSPTDITVTGSNLNPNYRIEVSHLGREPWAPIPTIGFTTPNLVGNPNTLLGGRYMVRVAVATSAVLIANWPTEILIPPAPIEAANPTPRADSITVNWSPVPGITQYRAIIRTSTPSTFIRTVNTSETSAVFSGLEPATSYDIELYTLVDGVPSFAYPLTNVTTQGVQMAPQVSSYSFIPQFGALLPGWVAANDGVLYFLDGPYIQNPSSAIPSSLNRLDLTSDVVQSVPISGMTGSTVFTGSQGLYVTLQETSKVIQVYDPTTLTPLSVYTLPVDSDMMQATYCAATDRVYCVRSSSSMMIATLTVLLPTLAPDPSIPETSLPQVFGTPVYDNMLVEASQDGSTLGIKYDFTGGEVPSSGMIFQGYFMASKTFADPIIRDGFIDSLHGGSNGSVFASWNSDQTYFTEFKPMLNKQFAATLVQQFSPDVIIQFDGNLNRWVSDREAVTAYDPTSTARRAFYLPNRSDVLCYDRVTRKILCTYTDSNFSRTVIQSLDADF